MTSPTDIANRALSEIGAQTLIADLEDEDSAAAAQCRLQYTPLRQQLLRKAHWGFARKTLALTELGLLSNVPPDAPYPWLVKYAHPADCLKVRYILPPPVAPVVADPPPDVSSAIPFAYPWCMPSRAWRYVVAYDDTVVPSRRVILSNVPSALAVYTVDVTNPELWDSLFADALVMALANKLVIPLSGNVGMKQGYIAAVDAAILQARVADGNEAIPSTDHSVDWIEARMMGGALGGWNTPGGAIGPTWGMWYGPYDSGGWGE